MVGFNLQTLLLIILHAVYHNYDNSFLYPNIYIYVIHIKQSLFNFFFFCSGVGKEGGESQVSKFILYDIYYGQGNN